MTAIRIAKSALRKQIKTKLNELKFSDKTLQSEAVHQKLFAHPIYVQSKRISVFLNMDDEIQTEPILKHAFEYGKSCYIPRYDSKTTFMDMVRLGSWEEYDALPVTKWNIKQPPLDATVEEALSSGGLDLILMPGLAFSKEGHRLGRGKGYYDTYLSRCREVLGHAPSTIALVYREQLVDYVPVERSDIPVDIVLTA
ncbi:methenyltetrahydrofolate synthetase [Oratosquilla oratoria]|uniref:methenyltetrahydrofolate synthetase n=1 Tax=Oratosquilla oratoria TaxID=337810 RepID=UPI003F762486